MSLASKQLKIVDTLAPQIVVERDVIVIVGNITKLYNNENIIL